MRRSIRRVRLMWLLLVSAAIGASAMPLPAQESKAPPGDLAQVTVTVAGRHHSAAPVALTREDVLVYQANERRPVVDWRPAEANAAGLDLAMMVDDSSDDALSVQFSDLSHFLGSLPTTTRVAIVYGTHGDASVAREFTADHQKAAQALRLPLGRIDEGSSIYLAVADLAKHWPQGGGRRAVLLISDGIDLFRGVADSAAPLNPDLQEAIDEAQRAGVTVYTIFADGAGRLDGNSFLINNGQGCLSRLSFETGGESYFQGTQTPLAFSPYLQQLRTDLGRQYILTFRPLPSKEAGFQRLRVTTEQAGVEITAPDRVFVPAKQ